jgi:ubiquinone/menaquinone biosynthesis C-methylase UbiE
VHIAKRYGCRVVGVDIREKMIGRATERAARERLADRAEFRVADAQALPFEDETFDAVICESVLAFVPDQPQAVREFLRVVKPGGYVGVTEAVWIREPTPELRAAAIRSFGGNLEILSAEGWLQLFEAAGLQDIHADIHQLSAREETMGRIRRIGCGNLIGMWGKALKMALTRPDYRRFLREAMAEPKELLWYWGHGVWVGRKK